MSEIVYPPIEQLKEVFFEGNLLGWPTGKGLEKTSPDLPGWKIIKVPVGDFIFLDRYTVGSDGFSNGFIEIRNGETNQLFWMMMFGGWYIKQAIQVVKPALIDAYKERQFIGGRGPRFFKAGHIIYENRVHNGGSFEKFRGVEEVFDQKGTQPLGFHWYSGGLMFDPK
ncbi:MAG: hypothetical protein ABH837_01580 [bacterium]